MNKIASAFANGKAFIPFITCGDPDLETTKACIREMVLTMACASAWPLPKPADVSAHSWIISAAFLAL